MNKLITPQQREKAEDLWNRLEGGSISLRTKVRRKEAQNKNWTLDDWKQENDCEISTLPSTITRDTGIARMIASGQSVEELMKEHGWKKHPNISQKLNKIEELVSTLEEYFNSKVPFEDQSNLTNMKWYAYFLYYPPNTSNAEGLIGRTLLEIDKNGSVTFKNTDERTSVDYKAKEYEAYSNLDPSILVLNLKSKKDARQLHIKAFYNSRSQDIMLGMFNTFEDHRIQNGTIVLQNCDAKHEELQLTKGQQLKPGTFSLFKNPDELETIHPTILDFLTMRHQNYNKVFEKVHSIDRLETVLDNYNEHNHKNTWFIEKAPPEVFIASPIYGTIKEYNDQFVGQIIKDLQAKLPKYKVNHSTEVLKPGDTGELEPIKNLKELKTTRVFILIVDQMTIPSFSLVQLGWALAHCKLVVLIYREENMSRRILSLKDDVLIKIPYKGELKKAWKPSLQKEIAKQIQENSPVELDGLR